MRVVVVGAGLMGAQIGAEYALGGHDVQLVARDEAAARARVEAALELLETHGLADGTDARTRLHATSDLASVAACDLAVESLPEDLDLKAELLRVVAEASPEAILATNTSSLSVTALGDAVGAPERTVGTHYWNPPLLMPLVEVIAGDATDPAIVERVSAELVALGKRPVACRDVPGFMWNRIQMAILREAVWLLEHDVAAPDAVDAVLTDGLARRWKAVPFLSAIALGGVETWQRTARNLFPELSTETDPPDLQRWVDPHAPGLGALARRRDLLLAEQLQTDEGA
jgi:3-hydroxybutyryl-CoA dehydrogenase